MVPDRSSLMNQWHPGWVILLRLSRVLMSPEPMGGDDRDGPDTILLSRPPEQRLGSAFLMTRLSPERHVGEHDPTAAWVQPLVCVISLDNAVGAVVERMDVVAEPPVSGH